VPGHWEGDLIIGQDGRSAIGTLVERTTRYTVLLHLPGRHTAQEVADAMITQMRRLPEHLIKTVTWDRGSEMVEYPRISMALDAGVYFCDPHSPWQRGTNENTVSLEVAPEGLIRKGGCRQQEVTPENTGRNHACLPFDVTLELPAPA
jgi:IS30 family transposase